MAAIQVGSYSITNSGLFLTAFKNPTVTTDPFTWFLERVSSPQASPPVYRIKAGQPAGDIVIFVEVSLEAVFEPAPDGAQPEKGSVLTIIGDSTAGWSITPDALRRGSIVTVSEFPEGVKFPDGVSVYLVQESGKVGWVAADNTVVGQVPEGAVWKFQRTDREFPGVGQAFKITNSGFLTGFNDGRDVTISETDEGAAWLVSPFGSTRDSKEPLYNLYAIDPPDVDIGAWSVLSLAPLFEPTLTGAQPEKGSVRTAPGQFGWSITADEFFESFVITASTFPEGVIFPDGISVYLVQQAGKVGWVTADNNAVGQVPEGAIWTFARADK